MSARKRVALFRNNFLPYSETFIHDELRFHTRYEAVVMARQWRNAARFEGHEVIAVERLPEAPRPLASAWYGLTRRAQAISEGMAKGRFDVVHAHFGHNGLYALPYARRHGLPLLISLHGRDVSVLLGRDKYRPAWWPYLMGHRRLFREATYFLAASQELKDLIEGVGCPPDKVLINRLGVDISAFSPAPERREAPPVVLMVGRFVEKKGHLDGIEAAAAAIKAGQALRLVIIGDGPLKATYAQRAAALGIGEALTLTGALPHAGVLDWVQRASVLLAPSVIARNLDRESGLIVAKEAAACGLPIIGTLHGGIPEIIDDGETGYLVAEHDAAALGARLTQLLSDEVLQARLGAAARRKMEREYDIRQRVNALEDIYDQAIEARRASERGA
ncbi:glycosyltransferase [Myxococcota bacterium]|nr:glycosyltransferase [Myxococcota bacterium]MBU1432093.1 glycosyltransferase [Myxococcota bacterium]MBU1896778.1 glycosyltransferase [Myxococcota bacterium]